ncbi:MAG: FHA domain-containing protein [Planctomycetia bacterium]|nr:FHA domain-containing protein [Planctomycetia bacterium]
MKAELVPDNGDPPIRIAKDVTVIGRKDYCDVVIDHPSLSKRHCVVVRTDGLLVIRDLVTTNGTKVKGQKIRWAALLPEDRITLGSYKLRVYLGSDDAPSPSERVERAPGVRPAAPAVSGPKAGAGSASAPQRDGPTAAADPSSGLEILDDDSGEDSGWRRLIGSKSGNNDDDVIIELD